MRNVRVAVVGCGNVVEKYVPHLQQSAPVDLVAVSELSYPLCQQRLY